MSSSSWGRDCRFHIPSTTSNSSAIDEEAAPTGDELCAGPAVSPQDQFNLAINHVSNLSGIWFCSICDVAIMEGRLAALNHLDSVEHKKMRSSYQPRKPPNVPEYYYIERNDYSGSVHCRLCRKRLGSVDTPMSTVSTIAPSCYVSSATTTAAAITFDSRSPSPAMSDIGPFPRVCSPSFADERLLSAMTANKMARLPTITPSTVGTSSSSSSTQQKIADVTAPEVNRHRASVLESIGLMLDEGLLDKDDSARAVLLATQGPSQVSTLFDLISSRSSLPAKAEFVRMYLSGIADDAKNNEASPFNVQPSPQFPTLPAVLRCISDAALRGPSELLPDGSGAPPSVGHPQRIPLPQQLPMGQGGTPPGLHYCPSPASQAGGAKDNGSTPPLHAACSPSEADSDDSRK
ncbi:hypothetical protein FOZ60_008217 [Perkinsus olseni]|uniref:Uncharacterized protein n=1 Tax=Perkinsus olseni TaxID=32597 RepID=A0A7J6NJQ9_PEROL|nr:hypothetical protein FOZ60_008217 [Perkinsus olseni]